jgi:hypothetical protein
MVAVRRGILIFGCAVAFASGPLVVAAPAVADGCPWGTTATRFPGVCTSGASGGSAPAVVIPPQASAPGAVVSPSPAGVGSVNGIPCTPEHYGTCLALQQSQG